MKKNDWSRRDFIKKTSLAAIAVLPAVDALSKVLGTSNPQTLKLVDHGFRLTQWQNLLNLDFYFINVRYKDKCLFKKPRFKALFGQKESYMIVRLPQQHIAEQYYNNSAGINGECIFDETISPKPDWVAKTSISGYSYLVFKLIFNESDKLKIPLTPKELLNWNDQRYKLVVRQNLTESLFNIEVATTLANGEKKVYYENSYPLGYEGSAYNPDYFPKAYGDPITAIEAPWRLIISPKLPDQDKFKFKWEFSADIEEKCDTFQSELWMATLTVEPLTLIPGETQNDTVSDEKKKETSIDENFRRLDLMFIGSPDHPRVDTTPDAFFKNQILPTGGNRNNLVELYIKYKLLAKADKLAFSPLGLSSFIEFKNTRIEETLKAESPIDLYSYKHLMSFGRDEEVEVTRLILDKETGLKLLLVQTTKRRTKGGNSYLDYREYIMPLELEKDYQSHVDANGVSKFNCPFKKIRFLETDPKRICPLGNPVNDKYSKADAITGRTNGKLVIYKDPYNNSESVEGLFYPQTPTGDLKFEFEITDWHNKRHKIRKSIQAITFKTNLLILDKIKFSEKEIFTIDLIDAFFDQEIEGIDASLAGVDNDFKALLNNIKIEVDSPNNKGNELFDKAIEQFTELKSLLITGRFSEKITERENNLITGLKNLEVEFKRTVQEKVNLIVIDADVFKGNVLATIKQLEEKIASIELEKQKEEAGFKSPILILDQLKVSSANLNKNLRDREDLIDEISQLKRRIAENPGSTVLIGILNQLTENLNSLDSKLEDLINECLQTFKNDGFEILRDPKKELLEFAEDLLKQVNARIKVLSKTLNTIAVDLGKKYKDQLDQLQKTLGQFKPEDLNKIQKQLRTNAYLQIVEDVRAWLVDIIELISKVSKNLIELAGDKNKQNFLTQIDDDFKSVLSKIENITKSTLIGGLIRPATFIELTTEKTDAKKTPLTFDLVPVFSDSLNSLASKVKLSFLELNYGYIRYFDELDGNLKSKMVSFRTTFVEKVVVVISNLNSDREKAKNLILNYRDKIGFAINQTEDVLEECINDELSALETDYILLKGEVTRAISRVERTVEGAVKVVEAEVIDFFNQYSSMPQLKHAQVYITSLTRLVDQELPVGIKYAQDYVINQADLLYLETKKNTAKVFAEIKESSKAEIQGAIRGISEHMGGLINPELPIDFLTYLTAKENEFAKTTDQFKDLFNVAQGKIEQAKKDLLQARVELTKAIEREVTGEFEKLQTIVKEKTNAFKEAVKNNPLVNDLTLIGKEAKNKWEEVKSFSPETYFKDLDARILGSISLKDVLGLKFDLPRLTPTKDGVTYNFITNQLVTKDFSFFRFRADSNTTLQLFFQSNFKTGKTTSFILLENFKLIVKLGGEEVLLVSFKEFRVSSGTGKSKDVSVKVSNVSFGGPLDFFGKLAQSVKIPGTGLRVVPSAQQLEVGYAFPVPGITSPSFNFNNLKFDVALLVPFARKTQLNELELQLSINKLNDKFLISAGIFGGRGHFVMKATPTSIQSIDTAIEFGGYFGINLGIASGHVFLFAGIRINYQKSGSFALVGYLICEGGVTVFGFISVYLTIQLALTYQKTPAGATLYGSASVTYSIKIGFFKKSFRLSFSKRITGAKGSNISQQETAQVIDSQREPVFYGSADNHLLQQSSSYAMYSESKDTTDEQNAEPEKIKDTHSFKEIYSKEDWNYYCESFS